MSPVYQCRMRDELLNESQFFGIDRARNAIAEWVDDYNTARPHSSLGYETPAAYATELTATIDRLRIPNQLRRSIVASPAPAGAQFAATLKLQSSAVIICYGVAFRISCNRK